MRVFSSRLALSALLLLALVTTVFVWYLHAPVALRNSPLEIEIAPGSGMRQVARQVAAAGVDVDPWALELVARLTGRAGQVKAGSYEILSGVTPLDVLNKLVRGDTQQGEFVLVEGWHFRRLRSELARAPGLKPDSAGLSDAELMAQLGAPGENPEGLFLPDTYFYTRGGSDLAVLRRAYHGMQRKLEAAWQERTPAVGLKSPYEALIMASLIEKESGFAADRPRVASVFFNRLRIGMPLQTDPSVIYGLGESYAGALRKRDLRTDTPYNTYTRTGLPPTPIAMPGVAALRAALNPPLTDYYYFVARGDGSSEFSRTLDEHNRAVARYQRRGNNG